MESDNFQASSQSRKESPWQVVALDPDDLRPHPSYAKHGLTVPACKLSTLRERGECAFAEALTIARDGTIIDGYARWELAKELKRPLLQCIEYELSETDALQWLLQRHVCSYGMNAFTLSNPLMVYQSS